MLNPPVAYYFAALSGGDLALKPLLGVIWLMGAGLLARNVYRACQTGQTRLGRNEGEFRKADKPTLFVCLVIGRALLALGMLALSLWTLGIFQ